MEHDYLEGLDDELKETMYQVGIEAMRERRWHEAVEMFRELQDMDSGYEDIESKLKKAELRARFAFILDSLDTMRPRWLSLWQFIGLIFGVGVILIAAILYLASVGRAMTGL